MVNFRSPGRPTELLYAASAGRGVRAAWRLERALRFTQLLPRRVLGSLAAALGRHVVSHLPVQYR